MNPKRRKQMIERIEKEAKEIDSILCFGIDPVLDKISPKKKLKQEEIEIKIEEFFLPIVEKLIQEKQIASIKPNYAYFAQYGFEGLFALKKIIDQSKNKVNIILDGKRGDIGATAQAYAKEMYDFWNADSITVAPYMGSDSIKPFLREDKTVYVLGKTSNKSATEIQDLKISKEHLFEIVAKQAKKLKCGLVVGATSDSILKISKICENQVPFLIPGIGNQGGDLETVMKAIEKRPYLHRINSSSGIAYAFEKTGESPTTSALKEAQKLNKEIKKFIN